MTTIDYARLRELAEKATPGSWIADEEAPAYTASQRVYAPFLGTEQNDTICEAVDFPDAEFIAAFNPETAKALLDEIERLRGEGDWEYAWELREPDTGDVYDRGMPQLNAAQAAALGALQVAEENRASPDEPPLTVHVVRRRKAGPWERVPEGEGDE